MIPSMTNPTGDDRLKENGPALLWIAAGAIAALGTWVLFDASPGVNWLIWTASAVLGLVLFTSRDRSLVTALSVIAVIIGGGATVTADPVMHVLIFFAVALLLAMAMLLSADPSLKRISAGFAVVAPVLALTNAIVHALGRAVEATHIVRSPRARAVLRGLAITLPVVFVFALLLAGADPIFASWRDAIEDLIADWDFLPRTFFFIALLGITLGAFAYAQRGTERTVALPVTVVESRWLGSTERLMLLSGVTALLWLFLLVQLSYLFGNLPSVSGSGITFAEYARRGFGELSLVASGSAIVVIVSERFGKENGRDTVLRALTLALIIAVLFLLGSAFRRVWLYEEAYGFTTARLYAQVYMIAVAVALLALIAEVMTGLQPARLFRRSGGAAAAIFIVLIYWNHEAWIARKNIDRFAASGKLDTKYLSRDLSPNAAAAILGRLPDLPEPMRTELRNAMATRYRTRHGLIDQKWFEWNLGRVRAREALERAGIPMNIEAPPAVPPVVTRATI